MIVGISFIDTFFVILQRDKAVWMIEELEFPQKSSARPQVTGNYSHMPLAGCV